MHIEIVKKSYGINTRFYFEDIAISPSLGFVYGANFLNFVLDNCDDEMFNKLWFDPKILYRKFLECQ